ncbi:Chromosome partition protein smc [hydrothermal vent metagenome]|uniref:Chromosome partition protein smc n=1 Tax=hydrothermal vent metagenome TaxID=652676 RepID=A0A3B0XSR2_9ZZZZ
MKLTKIKLAGFKSFVDPTTVNLPSNLIGIVGPNGCGKSNIIDAVRWVMGESSAKHLRGESMTDVIFNGSNARKPVGQAFIELVFDNSDGTVGGQYNNFNEIAVKRMVSRDGSSGYYLNGTKCRKRDITDVFLGTGLGPRSYSIIEQGMISRLIEAKPEELRVYLEEAAGISKYKERRRETENRIKHTRENLDRLNDLRDEVEKQLNRLQRQAKTAEKFTEFKQEERQLKAEALVLRLRDLDREITDEQSRVNQKENRLQEEIAVQRSIEAALEKDRVAQHEANEQFNEIQGKYYGIGGEIARKEQAITHAREMRKKQEDDLSELQQHFDEIQQHIDQDEQKNTELSSSVDESEPALQAAAEQAETSKSLLIDAEQKMHHWQQEWDEFNRKAAEPSKTVQVERIRIEQLERQTSQQQQRLQKLEQESGQLSERLQEQRPDQLQEEVEQLECQKLDLEQQIDSTTGQIVDRKNAIKEVELDLNVARDSFQEQRAKLISLQALQQAALGAEDEQAKVWIEQCQLSDAPLLIDEINVQSGWELAVETVLGANIDSVCVDRIEAVTGLLHSLEKSSISLFENNTALERNEPGTLSAKVSGLNLDGLLAGILVADSLEQAIAMRANLSEQQSIITKEGIWMSRHWLRVVHKAENEISLIERKQQIEKLEIELGVLEQEGLEYKQKLEQHQEYLTDLEIEQSELQADFNKSHQRYAEVSAELKTQQERVIHLERRIAEVQSELTESTELIVQNSEQLSASNTLLSQAEEDVIGLNAQRDTLEEGREQFRQELEESRHQSSADSDVAHKIELEFEGFRNQLQSISSNLQRMQIQIDGLGTRKQELQAGLQESEEPITEMEQQLQEHLDERVKVEAELNESRQQLDEIDNAMRQHEIDRNATEKKIDQVRTKLDAFKMTWQTVKVRRQTVNEQFEETGFEMLPLLELLPELASTKEWDGKVKQVEVRIQRLGAINLAAIDEYTEQLERKEYLDTQLNDINEALETLEAAIRKIDKETKSRFKETFEKVNSGLQDLFPRVFGGGHASLELIGDDLLTAGVAIMARPPGKRNSTIHLLSGGEKALTAVALVFSIFQLNPSPFCMLDEVDAPLDDANVARFCSLVKEMSEQVQFIFITHNKLTMAIANQLSGVTMQEAGVSRMVAVDVDEAVRLAGV